MAALLQLHTRGSPHLASWLTVGDRGFRGVSHAAPQHLCVHTQLLSHYISYVVSGPADYTLKGTCVSGAEERKTPWQVLKAQGTCAAGFPVGVFNQMAPMSSSSEGP